MLGNVVLGGFVVGLTYRLHVSLGGVACTHLDYTVCLVISCEAIV